MTYENPLYDIYEKLYFHEIEMRDYSNSRLQIPLAIIVAMVGSLAFLIQAIDKTIFSNNLFVFFGAFFGTSILVLLISIFFFIRSWYDYTYYFLPSAEETEAYRNILDETYKKWAQDENLPPTDGEIVSGNYLQEYICSNFIKCSTANAKCNEERSLYCHKTNQYLIASVISACIAFFVFCFINLEK